MGALRIDIERLHATWMELVFPRQLDPGRVVGKWHPETDPQKLAYYLWAALGAPLVAIGYPLLLVGFAARFYASRVDTAVARVGVVGVVLASLLVWGSLTAATWLSQISFNGFVAVAVASVVATVSAALAVLFSRVGGRITSIVFAYPAAMTAFFLPPVVAALYSPSLADVVFANSQTFAIWLLDNVLAVGGIDELLRSRFQLQGVAYVLMWFAIAVPLGWLLGVLVALADVVRPASE
ncbi:hypothetical protein HUG10_00255 [Halorarum halophilum]|uniref:Yip1 domain-containing protein n=1 Tax=Halorarum halophilum TaxID=2743090 RepID=A0A7D5K9W4_9EURY|nr:hypothetical protein [Halobaculum halophilum]QLG29374.1 hypothetical protein HUG10_00255 [Halobaculum halophilum]